MVVTAPVLPLVPEPKATGKVPSAPLAGREAVSRPLYSKIMREIETELLVVTVTVVGSEAPAAL
jgi:hypothetical protein